MNHPEQETLTEHHDSEKLAMNERSPMNMVWGLILVVLLCLAVVIVICSINIIADITHSGDPGMENPGTPDDPSQPDTPETPNDPATPDQPTPGDNTDPTNPGGSDPSVNPGKDDNNDGKQDPSKIPVDPGQSTQTSSFVVEKTSQTALIEARTLEGLGIYSANAVLVNANTRKMVAELNADNTIYPASMTKVMTLLVACENLKDTDWDRYVTMSEEIVAYTVSQNASGAGLRAGEELTIRDLMYAVALESDGAAAMQLAQEISGSQEAFVALMNKKCDELGLMRTNFTNCTGLHDAKHVTTCREMASIMIAAMQNNQVRDLLSKEYYKTKTNLYPGGRTFYSTYFHDVVASLRAASIQTQPSSGKIVAAKTGWTDESGYCLVTYLEAYGSGTPYVLVTSDAPIQMAYVMDAVYIYEDYLK